MLKRFSPDLLALSLLSLDDTEQSLSNLMPKQVADLPVDWGFASGKEQVLTKVTADP